jgi:hypothetical protein
MRASSIKNLTYVSVALMGQRVRDRRRQQEYTTEQQQSKEAVEDTLKPTQASSGQGRGSKSDQ